MKKTIKCKKKLILKGSYLGDGFTFEKGKVFKATIYPHKVTIATGQGRLYGIITPEQFKEHFDEV